jgi:hypothetical protein
MPAIFFNEPVFNQVKLLGLVELAKNQESQFFCFLSSQKSCRDLGIIGNHRSRKVLKVVTLGNTNNDFSKGIKSSIKKFFLEQKIKKIKNIRQNKKNQQKVKKQLIGITLKKQGFGPRNPNQAQALTMSKPGHSFLYIYQISKENGKKRDKIPTELKFHSKKKQKKLKSTNHIYIQKFDEEIKGFEMIGNKVHFWGSSVYGVIKLEQAEAVRPYGPNVFKKVNGVKILEAKLEFYKRFSHCLIERLVPFDENNFLIEPKSRRRLMELYNLEEGFHTVIGAGEEEKKEIKNYVGLLC